MLSVGRILRDHQDAGSVNSLVAVWGFVDDQTFITKAGHLGMVYRVEGVDYECQDQEQRRDIVHRFEASLRLLDESCRVYQYLCKRRIDLISTAACGRPLVDDAIQRHVEHVSRPYWVIVTSAWLRLLVPAVARFSLMFGRCCSELAPKRLLCCPYQFARLR